MSVPLIYMPGTVFFIAITYWFIFSLFVLKYSPRWAEEEAAVAMDVEVDSKFTGADSLLIWCYNCLLYT